MLKTIHKNIVVIVGGYSTGRLLATTFHGNGYGCIHIDPSPFLHTDYKKGSEYNDSFYLKNILYDGDVDGLIQELKKYYIKCVIPGSEAGVELADLVNDKLQLSNANDLTYSKARRDKYLMQETLRKNNVASIPQFLAKDISDILQWVKSEVNFPIVLKPLASSDSEGVSFCNSEDELVIAFEKIIGRYTVYGVKSEFVLAQKKMDGAEYVVNSVSHNGTHLITDIWTNIKKKIGNNFAYDYQDLVLRTDPIFNQLTNYIKSVLNALGIKYGAAHSEVIVSDKGPTLIETGSRLSGGFNPSATMDALGYSQLSILVESYLSPNNFLEKLDLINKNMIQKNHLRIISLIVKNSSGKIVNQFNPTPFTEIKGFHSMQCIFEVGNQLEDTTDMTTSPGNIYFLSKDKIDLQHASNKIREIENAYYQYLTTPEKEIYSYLK